MNNNVVYLYVFDTMADWEVGYLTAELNAGRYFKKGLAPLKIVTVGMNKTPVTTMGGLKILPDTTIDECIIEHAAALLLPGGDTWLESMHQPVLAFAERCLEQGVLVAAICGATMGLAKAGLLDSRRHTSNDLEYLQMVCPGYAGAAYYSYEPAVTDGNLITAAGVAPLEFSVQVLRALGVFSEETLDAWYNLFLTHKPESFFALMGSVQ
ncbi:MAG: type 1 glutamine amidotransferase family protein [Clostridiaceae bacterium]